MLGMENGLLEIPSMWEVKQNSLLTEGFVFVKDLKHRGDQPQVSLSIS